jgi:hypothetical protein
MTTINTAQKHRRESNSLLGLHNNLVSGAMVIAFGAYLIPAYSDG